MKEPRNLVFRLEGNALTIEVDIGEADLIDTILSALVLFVNKGVPLRITKHFGQSFSRTGSISSNIILKAKDMVAWADDLKRLVRFHQNKLGL